MSSSLGRKSRITLSDYSYRVDIEHRLMMAHFTEFEAEVLLEVLHGSLRFSVESLAQLLGASIEDVTVTLQNLQRTKLLQVQHGQVVVDKELRKYYESQMEKFDDDFEPDIDFALNMLRRVPIHVLPLWYAIPKSTDDIFSSIVEKHMETPETYRRYILDLCYDDPVSAGIIEDVFTAPDFKIGGKFICDKYKLSREQFEERLLLLEFQFVCFLSYGRVDGEWQEMITPLHEWRQLMRFQRDTQPVSIQEGEVERYRSDDFGFMLDLAALLRASRQDGIVVKNGSLDVTAVKNWFSRVAGEPALEDPEYRTALISRAVQIHLCEVVNDRLEVCSTADLWLRQAPQDRAVILYRCIDRATERDLRSVEKGFKRMIGSGWIAFEEFMKGFLQPIGEMPALQLVKKGKRWRYDLPVYSASAKTAIGNLIFQHLFQAGIIARGVWKGQECFKVTPFGKFTLGE